MATYNKDKSGIGVRLGENIWQAAENMQKKLQRTSDFFFALSPTKWIIDIKYEQSYENMYKNYIMSAKERGLKKKISFFVKPYDTRRMRIFGVISTVKQ